MDHTDTQHQPSNKKLPYIVYKYTNPETKEVEVRNITVVEGRPFYLSTGKNSELPGAWLPFIMLTGERKRLREFIQKNKNDRYCNFGPFTISKRHFISALVNTSPMYIIKNDFEKIVPSDGDFYINQNHFKSVSQIPNKLSERICTQVNLLISIKLGGDFWKTRIDSVNFDRIAPKVSNLWNYNEKFEFEDEPEFETDDPSKINNWLAHHGASYIGEVNEIEPLEKSNFEELELIHEPKSSSSMGNAKKDNLQKIDTDQERKLEKTQPLTSPTENTRTRSTSNNSSQSNIIESARLVLLRQTNLSWTINNDAIVFQKIDEISKDELEKFKVDLLSKVPYLSNLTIEYKNVTGYAFGIIPETLQKISIKIDDSNWIKAIAQNGDKLNHISFLNAQFKKVSPIENHKYGVRQCIGATACLLVNHGMITRGQADKLENIASIDLSQDTGMTLKFTHSAYAKQFYYALINAGYSSMSLGLIDETNKFGHYVSCVTLSDLSEAKRFIEETCGYDKSYTRDLSRVTGVKFPDAQKTNLDKNAYNSQFSSTSNFYKPEYKPEKEKGNDQKPVDEYPENDLGSDNDDAFKL